MSRWVLGPAAALSALLLAGCAAGQPGASGPKPPTSTEATSTSAPTARTTAQNVRAARLLSERLLGALPLPPGAVVRHRSPVPGLRRTWVGIGPSDPALSRHLWWTVPITGEALTRWLRSHSPRDMRAQGPTEPVTSMGRSGHELTFAGRSTAGRTTPYLDVVFVPHGAGQAVRLTTFVGARYARTVAIPPDTTTVIIRRTTTSIGERQRSRTAMRTMTATAQVRRLVDLANRLPGSMTVPFVASCPAVSVVRTVQLTFEATSGRYTLSGSDTPCWPQLTLRDDGRSVGPTLEPDRQYFRTIEAYLQHS